MCYKDIDLDLEAIKDSRLKTSAEIAAAAMATINTGPNNADDDRSMVARWLRALGFKCLTLSKRCR